MKNTELCGCICQKLGLLWFLLGLQCKPYHFMAVDEEGDEVIKEGDVHLSHGRVSGLYAHNFLRSLHGVPPLNWDPELAKQAKEWARELAQSGKLRHTDFSEEFSDNLYLYYGTDKAAAAYHAVHKWYSQIKKYPFDTHELKSEHWMTNAFSAVVWDEVQFLGMGISHHNGTKESYVVARYSPRPNVGNYEEHVKPQLQHKVGNKNDIHIPPIEDLIPPSFAKDKEKLSRSYHQ